jgi:hypothetical protein
MPDRLPSLVVLVGFWIPPAAIGWAAAALVSESRRSRAPRTRILGLTLVALGYALTWFLFNLHRMPPYIPGAVLDPTVATPQATRALAVLTVALILPGSAVACAVAFKLRRRAGATAMGAES